MTRSTFTWLRCQGVLLSEPSTCSRSANFKKPTEGAESLYTLIDEVFSAGPNAFLMRDTSGNAQMIPQAAIREVHCPEAECFEAGNDGTEGVYEFGSGGGKDGDKAGRHYHGAAEIFAETPFAESSDCDVMAVGFVVGVTVGLAVGFAPLSFLHWPAVRLWQPSHSGTVSGAAHRRHPSGQVSFSTWRKAKQIPKVSAMHGPDVPEMHPAELSSLQSPLVGETDGELVGLALVGATVGEVGLAVGDAVGLAVVVG